MELHNELDLIATYMARNGGWVFDHQELKTIKASAARLQYLEHFASEVRRANADDAESVIRRFLIESGETYASLPPVPVAGSFVSLGPVGAIWRVVSVEPYMAGVLRVAVEAVDLHDYPVEFDAPPFAYGVVRETADTFARAEADPEPTTVLLCGHEYDEATPCHRFAGHEGCHRHVMVPGAPGYKAWPDRSSFVTESRPVPINGPEFARADEIELNASTE